MNCCFFLLLQTMFSIDGNHLASDFHQQAQSFTEVTFMGLQTAMQPFVEVCQLELFISLLSKVSQ